MGSPRLDRPTRRHLRLRLALTAGLATGLLAGAAGANSAAAADDPSHGSSTTTTATRSDNGARVGVGSQRIIQPTGRNAHRGRGASATYCVFNQIDAVSPLGPLGATTGPFDHSPGTTLWRSCFDRATGRRISGPEAYTTTEAGQAAVVDVQRQLVEEAVANLDIDLPVPRLSPPGVTLPGIETWFWSDQPSVTSTSASAAGLTITATARLGSTRFDLGVGRSGTGTAATATVASRDDHRVISCSGAGIAYGVRTAATACTHRFSAPTRNLDLDVTTTWHLTWSATNGNNGDLGTVERTVTVPYRVQEKRTVIRRR